MPACNKIGDQWQRPALMFALVAILGLCLGLALWRAFRDHPTGTTSFRDHSTDPARMLNETRLNISISRIRRSECSEGVGWLDDPAYDIDPRSSNPDDVWEVSVDTIILHVDRLVAMPHCIKTMSVAVGESIIEFSAPIENEITLNKTGWDGCTPIEVSVTVFDEQNRTDRSVKNIEPEEKNCKTAKHSIYPNDPAGSEPETKGAHVAGPVLGGLVLCIVVVVLVFGVARTSIGRGTRKTAVSTEEENGEDIPMRPMKPKTVSSNRVSKRKSQIRERVDERMRTEQVDVEGCRYSFVEDYGTAYSRNQDELSEEDYDMDSAVKRNRFDTTLCDDSSV